MSAPLNPGGAGARCAPQCNTAPAYQIPGPAGVNAYTFTTALFTMPAKGGTVTVSFDNTIWMGAGNNVFIEGAGYFEVSSIPDSTHAVIINLGYDSNAAPGVNIAAESKTVPAGVGGHFGNAYTATSTNFAMPAVGAGVTIPVGNSDWAAVGSYIFVASAGYFQVSSIPDSTSVIATNLGYPENATELTVINAGQRVIPTGPRGTAGASGASTLNGISPTTTKGDIIVDNGGATPAASDVRLGIGSDGQVLVSDSSQPTGRNNATITPNSAATAGDIAVFDGTTGTPCKLKDSKMLITSDGALQSTPSGGNARGSKAVDLQVTRGNVAQVASGANSGVLAGQNNTASGSNSVIAGGNTNTASNVNTSVGGGTNNVASGGSSTVSGGVNNSATGDGSTVGGGDNNVASGVDSSVNGGSDNIASQSYASVAGGTQNQSSGTASTIGGGTGNEASGTNAFIGGGSANQASGDNSSVIAGENNSAETDFATVLGGVKASAYLWGQLARNAGVFALAGDCQASELMWRAATTDATANVEAFLDGASLRAVIPNNTTWGFFFLVTARSSAGVGASWSVYGAIQNNAGTVSLVSAVTTAVTADGTSATWGVAGSVVVDADNVHKSLRVRVTGAAATNIRWLAHARMSEVSY